MRVGVLRSKEFKETAVKILRRRQIAQEKTSS